MPLPDVQYRSIKPFNFQVLDGGWCLEVGLLVTGMGLLSHYLIGGIVMPLRLPENTMIKLTQYQICNFIRLGRSTGFLLGAYLVFTSAAMLWQVQQPILLCRECFTALIVPGYMQLYYSGMRCPRYLSHSSFSSFWHCFGIR